MTVKEHLQFFSAGNGIDPSKLEGWINSLLSQVLLDKSTYSKTPSELSGGMKKRLSLAIALARNPQTLLLDEPTTGLDPYTKRFVWEAIQELKHHEKRSVLLSTHSMEDIEALCDRLAIIHQGYWIKTGAVRDLLNGSTQALKVRYN
jgi:ABC-type multidrug transport system ATPase subunit